MSMVTESLVELALRVQCPRCHSYSWCRTANGEKAPHLHASRIGPFRDAFAMGYMQRVEDK